jgi:hypothetical protein
MSDEPFGRQPQPVRPDGSGDMRDVDYYLNKIKGYIENSSFDTVTRMGNQLIIHPAAVNN